MTTAVDSRLQRWYCEHGRHDLAWRHTRDRWLVLVSEVMLAQTQVARVAVAWPAFVARFPTSAAMAAATPGEVIEAWGRLGYPRRARRLWEAATAIELDGWPSDLTTLPGVGRYTAGAVRAQADGETDAIGIDVNIRRVCERVGGRALSTVDAETEAIAIAFPLFGRDRLLALMDLGAQVCTPRAPSCERCPLAERCTTRGERDDEVRRRSARYQGSFRERRGEVLARLRVDNAVRVGELDAEALESLAADGLAEVRRGWARLPRA